MIASDTQLKRRSPLVIGVTATVGLISFLANTGAGIVFPIFPKYLELFGGGPTQLGYLAAIFSFTAFVFSPMMGWMGDKIGRVKLIVLSMIVFALSNLLYAEADSLVVLYIARAFEGLSVAGIGPAALSIIAGITDPEDRPFFIGIVNGAAQAGFIAGPVLGGVFLDFWGLKAPFYISAGMGIASALIAAIVLPGSRKVAIMEQKQIERNKELNQANSKNKDSEVLLAFHFWIMTIVSFSTFLAWALIEPGFSFYIYDVLKFTPTQFGLFVSSYAAVLTIGQPFGGYLTTRIGTKTTIIVGLLIYSFSYLYLIVARELFEILLMGAMAGAGNALTSPAVSSEVTKVVPKAKRTTWLGVYSGFASSAGFVGPIIGGYVYPSLGPEKTFLVSFSIPFLVMLVFALIYRSPSLSEKIGIPSNEDLNF